MQGALSSAHSLLALVASAVLFGYLSMRLLISRMAKVILRIFQIMETAMAVSGGALLGGSSTSVTSKPKCSPILVNPRYTGYQVWSRQRTDEVLLDVDNVALGHGTFSGGRRSPRKTSSTRSSASIGTAEHGTSGPRTTRCDIRSRGDRPAITAALVPGMPGRYRDRAVRTLPVSRPERQRTPGGEARAGLPTGRRRLGGDSRAGPAGGSPAVKVPVAGLFDESVPAYVAVCLADLVPALRAAPAVERSCHAVDERGEHVLPPY